MPLPLDLDCRDRTRDFRIRPRPNVFRRKFGKLPSSFPLCNPFFIPRNLLGALTFVLIAIVSTWVVGWVVGKIRSAII